MAPVKPDSSSSMRSAIMFVAMGVAAAIKHRLNVTMCMFFLTWFAIFDVFCKFLIILTMFFVYVDHVFS